MQSVWRDAGRWNGYAGMALLILALGLCGQVTGSEVRAVPCTINAPGETGECAIVLDHVSPGLSAYEVQVTLGDPAIAEITGVRFPAWAALNSRSKVPADFVTLKGADTAKKVAQGDREVLLATLIIRGDAKGACELQVAVVGMKDEVGSPYMLPGRNGTLVVAGPDEDAGYPEIPAHIPLFPPPTTAVMDIPVPMATPGSVSQEITADKTSTPLIDQEESVETDEEDGTEDGASRVIQEMKGALWIDSDPSGAQVRVDGWESGVTPACLSLEGGTHLLSLSTEDGRIWEGEITVLAGQTLYLPPFTLRPLPRHVITAEAGSHGSVFPSGSVEILEGDAADFFFHPDPGYRLDGVFIDGVWYEPSSPVRFEEVFTDHALRGTFSLIPPPAASFTANQTEGYAPLAVRFLDQSTGDVSGMLWDFGDGTGSSDPCPVHLYTQAGNYTVSLEVCGVGGCNLSRSEQFITIREKDPLQADFLANTTSGPAPLMVQFQDLSTGDPDSWTWDFGDGTSATDPSPAHLFTLPGMYPVHLRICADGCANMAEKEEVVNVTPMVIGGSVGYFLVRCPAEGARVSLDGRYLGVIQNGTLTIPVYVTGTPCRILQVDAEGYLPYATSPGFYPREGETVELEIHLVLSPSGGTAHGRFQVPFSPANLNFSIPSYQVTM